MGQTMAIFQTVGILTIAKIIDSNQSINYIGTENVQLL